jgi:myo-inositol 2-dehydrogenase/D-chiro-inositol 1-dehydrogenase
MQSDLGLGLIGAGAIGRVHAKNVQHQIRNAKLVAVADVDQKAAVSVAEQSGNGKVYSDYKDIINDGNVGAIIVCVPSFLKPEIVRMAVERNKHIFVEKPMAITMKDSDEMVKLVEESGLRFQVGYQRRFDPSYLRAREAVESGQLGKLLLVKEHNRDPPAPIVGWSTNPARSGGMFLDTTSHDFDAVRWLAGSEVTRVYADGDALVYEDLKKNGDYDTVSVVMKLSNGAIGCVDCCYNTVYGFDSGLEILGSEAAVSVSMGERSFAHVIKGTGTSNEYFDGYASRWAQAYRDELADFVNCVLADKGTKATVRDGRAALEIGLAARKSIEEKKAVTLPYQ